MILTLFQRIFKKSKETETIEHKDYIKEYAKSSNICVIREDRYGSGLDKFLNMFVEANKTFPTLLPKDVAIKHYDGRHYAKTFGIEFKPTRRVPKEYNRIEEPELTK